MNHFVLVGSSWTIIVTLSYDDGSPELMLGGLAVAKHYLYSIDQLMLRRTRNTNKVRPLLLHEPEINFSLVSSLVYLLDKVVFLASNFNDQSMEIRLLRKSIFQHCLSM